MDPWYYLDLETTVKDDEDDIIELMEIASLYPDGSWDLKTDDYEGAITFKGKEYTVIEYDNTSKKITCYGKGKDTYELTVQ